MSRLRRALSVSLALGSLAAFGSAQSFTPGNMFVSKDAGLIVEIDQTGAFVRTIDVADFGTASVGGLAFEPMGRLWAASNSSSSLVALNGTGAKVAEVTGLDPTGLTGLAVGPNGEYWIARQVPNEISVYTVAGVFRRTADGGGLGVPEGIAFGKNGHLFVADSADDTVYEFDPTGDNVDDFALLPAVSAPRGVAFSSSGLLYVSLNATGTVVVLDASGATVLSFTHVSIASPRGLAFGWNGNLFVATSAPASQVAEFTPGGTYVRTIAVPDAGFPDHVAFAPARLAASVNGLVHATGALPLKVKSAYDPVTGYGPVLSLSPLGAMLHAEDDPLNMSDLATVFGQEDAVFFGVTAPGLATGSKVLSAAQASVFGDLLGHLGGIWKTYTDPATSVRTSKGARGRLVLEKDGTFFLGMFKAKPLP